MSIPFWSRLLPAVTLTLMGASLPAAVQATVPTTSVIEGVLLSSGGGPAADGNYTISAAIYAAETGGSAVWSESGVTIAAKGGQFGFQLGAKTPLSAAAISLPKAWLGIQIGTDPELARKPLGSAPYALRAAIAEALECTGCVKAGHLDAGILQPYAKSADLSAYAKSTDLSAYAKTSDLGVFAKTSDLSNYAKTADLADYVKATSLAKVAGTGSYNDLTNKPTLAAVAASGSYADLSNIPVMAKLGAACGTDLVMKGIKADGSYECVAAGIAADMINEVSNDLIWNQFVDKTDGTKDVAIKDGFSAGVTDTLNFPDIGVAQKIWIDFSAGNSDVSKLTVELFAPGMSTPYILYKGTKTGTTLVAKYNDTDAIASGDINKDWLNKNIKGNWSITVKDTLAISVPPGTPPFVNDGKFNWAVNIQTLSSKKIQIKGNLIVDGTVKANGVQLGDDTAKCDASKQGTLRYTAAKGSEICVGNFWVSNVTKPVLFTGYCSKHGTGGGWNPYCLDGAAINTAADYFSVTDANAGMITVKIPGYYRIHLNMLYNNCWNNDGVQLLKNGSRIGAGYSSAASGVWGMHIIDETWSFAVGDTIQIQAYNSGCSGYAYHHGSASGVWSKMSVQYAGSL